MDGRVMGTKRLMTLMMTLPDGTRAAVALPRELTGGRNDWSGLEPADPGEQTTVTFFAANREAVDRLMARYTYGGR